MAVELASIPFDRWLLTSASASANLGCSCYRRRRNARKVEMQNPCACVSAAAPRRERRVIYPALILLVNCKLTSPVSFTLSWRTKKNTKKPQVLCSNSVSIKRSHTVCADKREALLKQQPLGLAELRRGWRLCYRINILLTGTWGGRGRKIGHECYNGRSDGWSGFKTQPVCSGNPSPGWHLSKVQSQTSAAKSPC